jgi:hypothetical protein
MISTSASWPDAAGRPPSRPAAPVRLGMFAPFDLLARGQEAARAFLARVADAGIDHVCTTDFGYGSDCERPAMVRAAM